MKFESMKKNSWVIFESYMAALLIEQPEVAKSFIREIYHRILMVMTETLPPDITYQTWTSNILGRNIYRKKVNQFNAERFY